MKTRLLKIGFVITMSAVMLISSLNVTNVFASVNSETKYTDDAIVIEESENDLVESTEVFSEEVIIVEDNTETSTDSEPTEILLSKIEVTEEIGNTETIIDTTDSNESTENMAIETEEIEVTAATFSEIENKEEEDNTFPKTIIENVEETSETTSILINDNLFDALPITITGNYSYEIGPDGNEYIIYETDFLNSNATEKSFEMKTYASSNSTYTEGDFSYIVQDGFAYLSKYNGSAANLTVPSSLGGYPLKGVLYGAFYNNDSIEKISFSEGLVNLQPFSIQLCSNLKSIYFPSTFDYDGDYSGRGGLSTSVKVYQL